MEKEFENCYYTRKLTTFPSVEAVVMQFIVALCLYDKNQKRTINDILIALNQKMQNVVEFKNIINRVIPNLEKFESYQIESVLSSFLIPNNELILGVSGDLYFVKEYGENYEKVER